MPSVCVGCGLRVDGGVISLDYTPVTGYIDVSATYPDPNGMDAAGLIFVAPSASTGPSDNFGVATTEMNALVVENPSDCRDLTCLITTAGRLRIDVNTEDEDVLSNANELRNEIRVNGGDWYLVQSIAYAQDGVGRQSREWNFERTYPAVVIPPLGTLTIDRRCGFRWEQALIASRAFWNMPSITVLGV